MSEIIKALARRPPDTEVLTRVLLESSQTGDDYFKGHVLEVTSFIGSLHKKLDQLQDSIDKQAQVVHRITTSKLSNFFNLNPEVLLGFTVEKVLDEKKKDYVWKIFYNGSESSADITEAYNIIRKKLLSTFGYCDVDFKMMSESIIQAYHWAQDNYKDTNDVVLDAAILEVAYNIPKKFTISELKKKLPSLRRRTKDIEALLLENGWTFIQYQNSRVKYFNREN